MFNWTTKNDAFKIVRLLRYALAALSKKVNCHASDSFPLKLDAAIRACTRTLSALLLMWLIPVQNFALFVLESAAYLLLPLREQAAPFRPNL